jgi:hypothetical protein
VSDRGVEIGEGASANGAVYTCRGAQARVNIGRFRHPALQTFWGHRASTNMSQSKNHIK